MVWLIILARRPGNSWFLSCEGDGWLIIRLFRKVSVLLFLCVLEGGSKGIFVAVIETIRIEGKRCN
jgi:hypothetical protein